MKPVFLFFFSFIFVSIGTAQKVDTSYSIKSKAMNSDMSYSVYFPPSYSSSLRDYPILYLLHGMWGNETDWVIKGEVSRIATELIEAGEIPEMVIIMPDGLIDGFYINNYDGSVKWEDFFHNEFIPHIESTYKVLNNRRHRAIAGLSMGGYGTLYHAIKYPEKFAHCYPMSAAVIEFEAHLSDTQQEDENKLYEKLFGPLHTTSSSENHKKHSIPHLIAGRDKEKELPTFLLDCGDDDHLLKGNMHLFEFMRKENIPVEFRIRDGGHTWEYWRTGLEIALKDYAYKLRN